MRNELFSTNRLTLHSFVIVSRIGPRTLQINTGDIDVNLTGSDVSVRWIEPQTVDVNSTDAILRLGWTQGLPSSEDIFREVTLTHTIAPVLQRILERQAGIDPRHAARPISIIEVALNGEFKWVLKGLCVAENGPESGKLLRD